MFFYMKWGFLALLLAIAILNGRKLGWRRYIMNLLEALDRLGNALLGGNPLVYISTRCEAGYGQRWYWTVLGRILNLIQPGHIDVREGR